MNRSFAGRRELPDVVWQRVGMTRPRNGPSVRMSAGPAEEVAVNLMNLMRMWKRADYLARLEPGPKLALADGSLPHFGTTRPVELRQARSLETPIIRTGRSGEAASRSQVTDDYLFKGTLSRGLAAARELTHRRPRPERQQLEEASRYEDERFRSLFEQAAVGMALLGLDGRWLLVNEKLSELLGFTRSELSMRTSQEMTHLDDRATDRKSTTRLLSGEMQSDAREKRFVRRDGTYRWYRVTRSLARSSSGNPECFITVVEDIGERRRTEEALRESEERYRFLFDNNPQSMWVYDPRTFALLAVNHVATKRYGYSHPEFLGMTLNDIRPPDGPDARHSNLATCSSDSDVLGAWRLRRKDGTLVDVEISSQLMRFGDRQARLVIAHDITERKRAEEQQKHLQEQLEVSALEWQVTFDAIESPVLIFCLAGRLTKMNRAAREVATDSEALPGERTIDNLGSNPLWCKAAELMNSIRRTRVAESVEARDQAAGRTWQLNGTLGRIPGTDDERMILVISEMTHIVELQASLCRNEAMSMLGSLVSGVAHEVRNPLFGISSTLDAYEACSEVREGDQRYLVVLRKEVNRLNDLMKDLLDFGQPPNRELQSGSIGEAIARAVGASTPLARRTQVEIVSRISPNISPVQLNPDRLPQVFLNLLENAIQHSPSGGRVTVDAEEVVEQNRTWIVCAVRDSGSGFRTADLSRVFEPFFTRRAGGTGLGLSIVQRIVEEHGGTLLAGNSPEGGALMVVRLPVSD